MQGLADGYFVIPYTLPNYFASEKLEKVSVSDQAFKAAENEVQQRTQKILGIKGNRTADSFHRELGKIMWDKCGMARDKAGLEEAIGKIQKLRGEFWQNVKVLGEAENLNQSLEKAGRVADFLEFGELMCRDALNREESCGGHFRTEHQTEDGEAKRDDEKYCYAGVWENKGAGPEWELHKEPLAFENVKLATRSYK
jgi:succinate dehydrogenase / fumarate reductase flavoprotein subunit